MLRQLDQWIPFPPQASSVAASVDRLYIFLIVSTVSLAILLAVLVITFAIRYHRRHYRELPPQKPGSPVFEYAWTGMTFVLFVFMFLWGAQVYFNLQAPPANAIEMFAVGKQWMWKVQHPGGQREINELHVPSGQPVRLTMTSQDVIHSFFIPAFRVKQDVLPGRYTTLWFTATQPGTYHLFCAEYCGTKHSGMIGSVYVLSPAEYQRWLTAGAAEGSLASTGQKLYRQFACSTCHLLDGSGQAPNFRGLYGSQVRLEDGSTILADETYLRESILQSQVKVVLGYKPIMPLFQGQLTEDQVLALIEFIRALRQPAVESGAGTAIAGSEPEER